MVGSSVVATNKWKSETKRVETNKEDDMTSQQISGFGMLLFMGGIYFMPWLNAVGKKHLNAGAIFFTNLFFGWTIVGWAVALIWSCTNSKRD